MSEQRAPRNREYKDLPGFRVCPRYVIRKDTKHKTIPCSVTTAIVYDIFREWNESDKKEYGYVAFKEEDKYWPVGQLDEKGLLRGGCLGKDAVFIGNNVKNAVRWIFLRSQQPLG